MAKNQKQIIIIIMTTTTTTKTVSVRTLRFSTRFYPKKKDFQPKDEPAADKTNTDIQKAYNCQPFHE